MVSPTTKPQLSRNRTKSSCRWNRSNFKCRSLLPLLLDFLAPLQRLLCFVPTLVESHEPLHHLSYAVLGTGVLVFVQLHACVRFEEQRLGVGIPFLLQPCRTEFEPAPEGV